MYQKADVDSAQVERLSHPQGCLIVGKWVPNWIQGPRGRIILWINGIGMWYHRQRGVNHGRGYSCVWPSGWEMGHLLGALWNNRRDVVTLSQVRWRWWEQTSCQWCTIQSQVVGDCAYIQAFLAYACVKNVFVWADVRDKHNCKDGQNNASRLSPIGFYTFTTYCQTDNGALPFGRIFKREPLTKINQIQGHNTVLQQKSRKIRMTKDRVFNETHNVIACNCSSKHKSARQLLQWWL